MSAESATYTANMGTNTLSWDSSWGITLSSSSDPTFNAYFAYTPAYNGAWRYPPSFLTDRQGGSLGGNYPADHHTIVVETDTCNIWETYHAYVNPANGAIEATQTCSGRPCNAQSGWKYNGTSYALPTQGTTDAAGLPALPLLWRGHEILDGALTHAIRFTLGKYYIQAGNPQWPASGTNGSGSTNSPPYGQRFRLKASAAISVSGLTAQQQVYANTVITALRRYGMILADIGTNFNAQVDDQAAETPDIMAALNYVGSQIRPAQLEAVDVSELKPTVPSYQVANSLPVVPRILVGTPYHTYLNTQAGASFQLSSWVNGPTTQKGVTWEVASGNIGTVTPGGMFTAATGNTGLVQGVLKVTALADPTESSTVYVRVAPAGAIRVAAGLQNGTITDHLGNVWMPNIFFKGGDTVYHSYDYPNWPAPSNPTQAAEMAVYQTSSYTYGNDQVTTFYIPNGTYSVRLMFGQPYGGNSPATCSPFLTQYHSNVSIELQNVVVLNNFDFGASINHACGVPVDLNFSANVTVHTLRIALRNTTPDGTPHGTSPQLNGLEIIRTK